MRILLPLAAGLLLATAAPALAQKGKASAKPAATVDKPAASAPLAALFEAYSEAEARLFPLGATSQGDYRYNDQLPNDQTRAFRQQQHRFYQQYLASLQKFDRAKLAAEDQVSYDIFKYEMETNLAGFQHIRWMMPFGQAGGLPQGMAQYGSGTGAQPFKTAKDYDNWLSRVHAFTAWSDSAVGNFRQGMARGVLLPKALVVKMIPQLDAMVVTDPTKSVFYGPIAKLPASFSEADKTRLTSAYQQAIVTELVPAYQKLSAFLKNEYLPKARSTSGFADLPGGPAAYRYAVQAATTTAKTPEQIYQTGLSEVKRLRTEMEAVKNQVGFQGDLPAFFAYMKNEPKFRPYKTPQEVLDGFEAIHQRMLPNLKKMFGRTPKTPFEVRQTEAYRAASASAQYSRGSADGTRAGIFYVPILDATQYNITSLPPMEDVFLHEAIPGHHYQISLQQENTALPKFRRFGGYSAFSEGWGLYCESLGKELGLYTDPYQYAGSLGGEMHRAIRLVVDVGLHAKGMTREEAIKYMLDNEVISEQLATAEIERYMGNPGQALSYKVGQLKLLELRARYEKQLGPRFSLRAFHDELLAGGSMPLAVLERKMDAWAARQR
ncbi:DUF885 domain-containing protein [Hymenobacter sp. BT770]|uniref:DUF885 domain-containing protein n=1 Tax=Hymenobacter sp. BT770 TaxID=2886942 RepID=UPI001D12DB2F|nr:DUF885 domain-containing protein [Hymenobacter sp. BT770]MCC3154250.1 DUF885 domain-containing protein [Hymenobacter sp. BT770]MDO3416370.1 DUF885 domain-containing protein [Hymenobacter sp. BT770]